MAMMIIRSMGCKTKAARRKLHEITSDATFMNLCAAALYTFADGRLPGDLGDTPEAVETGEGRSVPKQEL